MTTLYDEIRELQAEVQRLQRALNFWLPVVPAHGPEVLADRIGHDAGLLVGYEPDGDHERDQQTAEELGWIRLSDSISAPSSSDTSTEQP